MFKLMRYLLLFLALTGLHPVAAHADWTDDTNAIARLMYSGEYAAAEKFCTEALSRGPSGLFSGVGTLVIHHWRGRARLIQGNIGGAIEDADVIIRTKSAIFPPDPGYTLRGTAKALQGDASGAMSEFEALTKIDRSGILETVRIGGFHAERGIARMLTGDLDGADADLAAALALDYGFLGGETMRLNKLAWAEIRSALAQLKTGNNVAAVDGLQRARKILIPAPEMQLSNDFVLAQLLINKFSAPQDKTIAKTGTVPAAPAFIGKLIPGQRSYWGFVIRDTGGSGVALSAVKNDSPAGLAGLAAGDVLISVEGKQVNSAKEFRAIKNTFPFFTPLKLTIKRNDQRHERTIVLYGDAPLKLKPARVEFTVPGIPPKPDALAATPDRVNVLDQVVLEPSTGKIAIIGHYDARYDTGSIPYLDMLKTALRYPKPKFNLETEHDTAKLFGQLGGERKDWPTKEFVLTHPLLEQDRQLMIKAWASTIGLLPEELVILYNHVYFSAKDIVPPVHIRKIQEKLLRHLGYQEAADAYTLLSQATTDGALKALQLLGRGAEAKAILTRFTNDTAMTQGWLTAEAYLAILERIHVPMGKVTNLKHDLVHRQKTWQDVVSAAQENLVPIRSSNNNRDLARMSLNRIMLSDKGSRALFPELMDNFAVLAPIDLDPNSQLAQVLYEADYSLKSLVVMPHLFRHIPGAMSLQEYSISKSGHKTPGDTTVDTQHWLEPEQVIMNVSPERQLVSFGASRMQYRTRVSDATGDAPPEVGFYDDWNAAVTRRYDEYAQVMPAFHKVREAAKVIALANWLLDEKLQVDLSDVSQLPWDAPKKVPGFWRVAISYVAKDGDDYTNSFSIGFSGGVNFKGQNWTRVSEAPPARETGTANQLALSAGLGQQAVQAAQGGDLDAARHLAELSAQAMSGRLAASELAKLKITVPPASTPPLSPTSVKLQQALLQRTSQQIADIRQNPASALTATTTLNELAHLYRASLDQPAAASDYLIMLQTGAARPPPKPTTPFSEPAMTSVCGQPAPAEMGLTLDEKAYLAGRLDDARDRLRYINEALRKLIAINASERAEIEKLTSEISARYEEAQDRAWDVVIELLTSVSLDAFGAEQAKRLAGIDNAISARVAVKATPQDAAQLRAIENEIALLQSAKFRTGEAYAATEELVKHFKRSKTAKDVNDWWLDNEGLRERAKNGAALVAGLALDHPWLEKWLGRQAFFAGEKLWQVATMGKMAYYASGFAYDIIAQWTVWEPMTHRMQNDLQYNVQGIERLRLRAEQASKEINCLKSWVR